MTSENSKGVHQLLADMDQEASSGDPVKKLLADFPDSSTPTEGQPADIDLAQLDGELDEEIFDLFANDPDASESPTAGEEVQGHGQIEPRTQETLAVRITNESLPEGALDLGPLVEKKLGDILRQCGIVTSESIAMQALEADTLLLAKERSIEVAYAVQQTPSIREIQRTEPRLEKYLAFIRRRTGRQSTQPKPLQISPEDQLSLEVISTYFDLGEDFENYFGPNSLAGDAINRVLDIYPKLTLFDDRAERTTGVADTPAGPIPAAFIFALGSLSSGEVIYQANANAVAEIISDILKTDQNRKNVNWEKSAFGEDFAGTPVVEKPRDVPVPRGKFHSIDDMVHASINVVPDRLALTYPVYNPYDEGGTIVRVETTHLSTENQTERRRVGDLSAMGAVCLTRDGIRRAIESYGDATFKGLDMTNERMLLDIADIVIRVNTGTTPASVFDRHREAINPSV